MKDKKLQVFVSSTYTDLKAERQAAVEAILTAGDIPAGMELFTAGDQSQMDVIKRWIDESDVYLLILGARYGSLEPSTGKSYTQLEYEYAVDSNKPYFAIVLGDDFIDYKVTKEGRDIIEPLYGVQLKDFKKSVLSKIVNIVPNVDKLQLSIIAKLSELSRDNKLIGWVRGNQAVDTTLLAEQIANLSKENSDLRIALGKTSITTTILYNGLTYEEVVRLLESKRISDISNVNNLYDLFMKIGPKKQYMDKLKFIEFDHYESFRIYLGLLTDLGLIITDYDGRVLFEATNDGHKFYLKSVSKMLD